jgi:hypothetical protein
MALKSHIKDGTGSGRQAHVTEDHALLVSTTQRGALPVGTVNKNRYFSGNLGSTGLNSGTINMNVDGSVTPVIFYAVAEAEYDFHVQAIQVLHAGASQTHNNFGSAGVLINGFNIVINEEGEDTYLLQDAKTNGQMLAYSGMIWNVQGAVTEVGEIGNWSGNTDAFIVTIPIGTYLPGGLRIGIGSTNGIQAIVRDDLTDLDEMYVRLFGYRSYPA